jgi:hypothetical protein
MQIGILAWIIAIVEQQVAPVAGDERLHGVILVADDLDRPRTAEFTGRNRHRRRQCPKHARGEARGRTAGDARCGHGSAV